MAEHTLNDAAIEAKNDAEFERWGKRIIKTSRIKKENYMIKIDPALFKESKFLQPWPEGESPPYTNDTYMAAYLGYSDKSEYIEFMLSAPILELYSFAEPYLRYKHWQRIIFQNQYKSMDNWGVVPSVYRKIIEHHGNGGGPLTLAELLIEGYKTLQSHFVQKASVNAKLAYEKRAMFASEVNEFLYCATKAKAAKNNTTFDDEGHPVCEFPSFSEDSVKEPVLGPLEGEVKLERYNRIFYVLKAVHALKSLTKWLDHGFNDSGRECRFSYDGIPERAKPSWMRERNGPTLDESEDEADSEAEVEGDAESEEEIEEHGSEEDVEEDVESEEDIEEEKEVEVDSEADSKATQTSLQANTQQSTSTDGVKYSITLTTGDSALFAKIMATIAEHEESLKAPAPKRRRHH